MVKDRSERMAALERRLREIEQQKAELERKMSRTRSWLTREQEDSELLVRKPRLQPAALPAGARVRERVSTEEPERIASSELGPAGEELKQAVTPQLRIRSTETVQPFGPGLREGPTLRNRETPLDPYGVLGEVQRDRRKRGEGSPKAKAIFMTVMTLVLAYVLFRMMT